MPVPGARVRPEPLPIELGGTGERSRERARVALDVPSLTEDNTFTGDNRFDGTLEMGNAQVTLSTSGTIGGTTLSVSSVNTNEVNAYELNLCALGFDFTGDRTLADNMLANNLTSGDATVTLPTAVGKTGRLYILKNSGAGTLTLATTSGQTIDGAAPGTIGAGGGALLLATNGNWITLKV